MPLLRDSPDDFAVLVERVAAELAYPPAFVERDYWITEILRSIAQPIDGYDASVIFKGGTSLSKGWRLLQRMSERRRPRNVRPGCIAERPRSRPEVSDPARRTRHWRRSYGPSSRDSVHRARYFGYSQQHAHPALTGERVLLELGTRGGPEPHRRLTLRSLLADVAIGESIAAPDEFAEFAALEIDTLSPERTLFEKLAALHNLASKTVADPAAHQHLGTKLRHAYDIAMLLNDDATLAALRALDRAAILEDIERRSVDNAWEWTPRPAGGYADSPAFDPTFTEHPAVSAAYTRALELVVGGAKPSLDDLAELARSRADLL